MNSKSCILHPKPLSLTLVPHSPNTRARFQTPPPALPSDLPNPFPRARKRLPLRNERSSRGFDDIAFGILRSYKYCAGSLYNVLSV